MVRLLRGLLPAVSTSRPLIARRSLPLPWSPHHSSLRITTRFWAVALGSQKLLARPSGSEVRIRTQRLLVTNRWRYTWWRSVVGGQLVPGPDGHPRWLVGGAGLGDLTWKFVPVPEAKAVKNRVHWDVTTPDLAAVVAAGATVLRRPDGEVRWTVLADPEGNEFCAFEDQPTTS